MYYQGPISGIYYLKAEKPEPGLFPRVQCQNRKAIRNNILTPSLNLVPDSKDGFSPRTQGGLLAAHLPQTETQVANHQGSFNYLCSRTNDPGALKVTPWDITIPKDNSPTSSYPALATLLHSSRCTSQTRLMPKRRVRNVRRSDWPRPWVGSGPSVGGTHKIRYPQQD